jgi:hypothetical protein
MSPDGMTLAVRNLQRDLLLRARDQPAGPPLARSEAPCFLGEVEPQGEAIDYLDDKTLLLGSETSRGRQGMLHRVQCSDHRDLDREYRVVVECRLAIVD